MKYLLIGFIKLYRLTLSKIKPPCCRFYPTCSVYGINAIRRFGSVKGGYLTIKRIVRCNPFSAGGYDPVPERFTFFNAKQTIKDIEEK
ncbi:MAG: membrane protein insertion efficiency factor YidD [Ruminiclostridium sp.]|nr:membrane protein insertion efficiency factor YidD [Ruminiclostridium sp.]